MILVIIGIWSLLFYLEVITLHGQSIAVPNLRAFHETELESIVQAEKLQYKIVDSVFVEKMTGGLVIEQNPDSGSLVKEGRKIYVTISAYNAPKVTVPNLQYDDKRNVIAQFQSIGLKIGKILYIPSTCTDCLERIEVDNSVVVPGSKLDQGKTVDLIFGGGKSDQFIQVPTLIGLGFDEVREKVLQAGLVIGSLVCDKEFEPEDSLNAKIYKQIPSHEGDEVVFLGSSVQVFFTTDYNKIPEMSINSLETVHSDEF